MAVRLSRKTLEDALAAFGEVTFFGALRCESALPPAVLDLLPVDLLFSVLDAAVAAFLPVTFRFATVPLLLQERLPQKHLSPQRLGQTHYNILVAILSKKTGSVDYQVKLCPGNLSAIRY